MKEEIRTKLKRQRAELTEDEFTGLSSAIASTVKNSDAFKNAQKIGYYHSVRGEADPSSLKTKDKHFYLPALSKNKKEGLVFIKSDETTQFEKNKFNIPEPQYNEEKIVKANSLDLVIVPLLAFDKYGNRLGMGGGFYDRCFAFKQNSKTKPLLMAYAYSFQEVDLLEPEPWDVGLDIIATENTLIIPEKNNLLERSLKPIEHRNK